MRFSLCQGKFISIIASGLATANCSTVPSLAPTGDSIPIYKIVQRVKCDLYGALKDELKKASEQPNPLGDDEETKRPTLAFLKYWVANVNLTLIANNQSGISPGVSFVNPLIPVVDKVRGTFPQSFSLGIGAGVSSTATRTEVLTFTISFDELQAELGKNEQKAACPQVSYPVDTDLTTDLGLKEWITSALGPVSDMDEEHHNKDRTEAGMLKWGIHRARGGGGGGGGGGAGGSGGATPATGSAGGGAGNSQEDSNQEIRHCLDRKGDKDSKTFATSFATLQEVFERKDREAGEQKLKKAFKSSELGKEYQKILLKSKHKLTDKAYVELLQRLLEKIGSKFKNNSSDSDPLQQVCAQKINTYYASIFTQIHSQDPPIDTISHTVQFFVAWNANATPSWSLMRFKACLSG